MWDGLFLQFYSYQYAGYINKMEQRLSISEITPLTTEWTCKVQAVDKFRPRDSRDQRVHFQTIIVQDEEQVCVILYGDDIRRCDNLFELFETYLISTAKVRNPQPYSLHIGQFEWIVDRFTIVESIQKNNENEAPLPLPSRLSTISFADVAQQPSGVEVDLLAVVANCGAMQYTADQSKRFREAIVIDKMKKPLFVTTWEDLASNEGAELLRQVRQLQEYPIILAKRIGTTKYQGVTVSQQDTTQQSLSIPYMCKQLNYGIG
ncbi:replication protein A 70 kDa DNA-binding subunit D isoform X5 [Nicotiana tabacum]|uniref:Replication protein A 70 kDa DNA-binding subunit D isoform X5 n=1 Tax=Nicotiana tabacum TaxID=4097 RepID=A0AC58SWM0_TOBAC